MEEKCLAVIIGVGPERGLGGTLAEFFSAQGLHVIIAGRSEEKLKKIASRIESKNGTVTTVVADATVEHDVEHLFDVVQLEGGNVEIAVYNVDSNIPAPLLETEAETFSKLWQQNCFGAFLFAKAALDSMLMNQRGTLIFTGATASLRAKPPFTAFASAKFALRALAQGLAREFSPQGIHVLHAIIDGVIDGDRAAEQFPDYIEAKGKDGLLQLEEIAKTYWAMHQQHPSAWTHEIDLRPFKEDF
ncbi:MAG: SDR family NAD(P)-dependent oxidoreductase [Methylococcaceae bacterium]|nr:SDR family NAD(P)-dependent oxidoreductase [Methylococcaceae bacterium]